MSSSTCKRGFILIIQLDGDANINYVHLIDVNPNLHEARAK